MKKRKRKGGEEKRYGVVTDIGLEREKNQDSYIALSCEEKDDVELVGVADGMGGGPSGEKASAYVVGELEKIFRKKGSWKNFGYFLNESIKKINQDLVDMTIEDPALTGMGTTLTCAYVKGCGVEIYHVGDSRAYAIRGDEIILLTKDHTLAGVTRKKGGDESLLNVLGGSRPGVHVDINQFAFSYNDLLLICSDGLTKFVDESEIVAVISKSGTPRERAERLIKLSREREAKDNVTVIVFQF